MVLINPVFITVLVIFILAFMLLLTGIEKVINGILVMHGKSRFILIGLGILVIIISLFALIYPLGTSIIVAKVLGIALLVQGISRIIYGIRNRNSSSNWSRAFGIGVGVISLIFALVILNIPKIGLIYAGIYIAISLLVTSIQIISEGISGLPKRRYTNIDK